MSAEYLLSGGNEKMILCERGVRTFSNHSRITLDLNVVPLVRQLSHLPILVDPPHVVGDRPRVRAVSRVALAACAQGLLMEAHTDLSVAYTDAHQTISKETLMGITRDAAVLAELEE